jgi:hypothetical protein
MTIAITPCSHQQRSCGGEETRSWYLTMRSLERRNRVFVTDRQLSVQSISLEISIGILDTVGLHFQYLSPSFSIPTSWCAKPPSSCGTASQAESGKTITLFLSFKSLLQTSPTSLFFFCTTIMSSLYTSSLGSLKGRRGYCYDYVRFNFPYFNILFFLYYYSMDFFSLCLLLTHYSWTARLLMHIACAYSYTHSMLTHPHTACLLIHSQHAYSCTAVVYSI